MTDDKIKQKAIEAVADIYGNILHLWLTVFLFFFFSLLWMMDCSAVETWKICSAKEGIGYDISTY